METVEGLIESIIYSNEQNGYTVCEIRWGKKLMTAVGYMPEINEGETLKINGTWVNHQDYGEQLKVEYFERILPTETAAIERYLASGVIKGIGQKTAKRIVSLYGKETFSVLEFEPERLKDIKGMTLKKAMAVSEIFKAQQEMRAVTMFFQKYGISALYASKIYKIYGANSIEEIRENPYKLTDDRIGIGFKTADKMAVAMGIDRVSKFRIQSGVKYVLSRAAMDGNTYLPQSLMLKLTADLLCVRLEEIEDVLVLLALEDSIYVEKSSEEESRVFLSAFQTAELGICKHLKALSSHMIDIEDVELDTKIKALEDSESIQLAEKQKEAIVKALKNGVMVITGGPGTGKTTIIKCILSLLEEEGLKTLLAAPTGRAAKRMSEATGFEAKTLHRLLEMAYSPDSDKPVFNKGEDNPIDADIIIIDEMSMVDTLLMYYLLKAIEGGTRLILVGDMDQLPSVGAGRVLADIIESEQINTVKLDEIFRQAQESMIIVNAHRINMGEYPKLNVKDKDFFFMKKNSGEEIVSAIVDLCDRRLPQSYGYNSVKDIQVLTPTRKGSIGVINLNNALQKVLNPSQKGKSEKTVRDFVFREGDRVMQVKNNYNLKWTDINNPMNKGEGVYNGDMGIISKIDDDMKVITVEFDDDKVADYDFELLDELQLSYAITIHKSQGSEFPVVIIPMYSMPPMLINRNLLYTAVTRARKLVILVGWDNIMCKMVDNRRENERYSALRDKLTFNGTLT